MSLDNKDAALMIGGRVLHNTGAAKLRALVSDLVVARNCCMARMLPGEAELVSE